MLPELSETHKEPKFWLTAETSVSGLTPFGQVRLTSAQPLRTRARPRRNSVPIGRRISNAVELVAV